MKKFYRIVGGKVNLNPSKNIIVITGCDSGFGESTSTDLASQGYLVVSGCYTNEGVNKMKGKVAKAILCDITNEKDVKLIAKETELLMNEKNARLWAVINNAGIADTGLVDWLSMQSFRRTMEVNYFGTLSVIKNMLPLLKITRGSRIINVCSMAGMGGIQFLAAYSGSKHAVEGMAKCLRLELKPWGIHVCNINPTMMRTPIINNSNMSSEAEFYRSPVELQEQYDLRMFSEPKKLIEPWLEDPVIVVEAIKQVVTDRVPPMHSYVGLSTGIIRLILMLPDPLQNFLLDLTSSSVFSPKQEALKRFQGGKEKTQ